MTNAQEAQARLAEQTLKIQYASQPFQALVGEIGKVLVGQRLLVHRMIVALLGNGHLLIEGVPGLAKTLAVSSLAKGINTDFQRLQFTPDLLPADLIGTEIYKPQTQTFEVRQGPIFSNLILADEINRAPAKVQAALLEAMQERQVTIGHETFKLAEPFLVMATQNPVEQEGTYSLPEAQVDRFMMKVIVGYPTKDEEREILARMSKTKVVSEVQAVMTPQNILDARVLIDQLYVDQKIANYVVDIVHGTRYAGQVHSSLNGLVEFGASPRASIALTLAAKANAFLMGRAYVVPQDVKDIALDVLRHRVILSYEAEAEERNADDVIKILLDHIPVP